MAIMKPATNLRELVPGLWCWSSFHEEWKVDFSSVAWKNENAFVLIDPIKLDDANLARLEKIAKATAILLTNQNHERDADWFRQQFSIKIHVHRDAVPGIEIKPDEFFCDAAVVPGGLKVVHLPEFSPSESALYSKANGGMVLMGDAVLHLKDGLEFLPEKYCKDVKQSRKSLKKLLAYEFETITFAHGVPIHSKAKEQIAALLKS